MIFLDYMPSTIVGFIAVGLALAFLYADPHSRTTRALALAFAAMGCSLAFGTPFVRRFADAEIPDLARLLALLQWVSVLASAEWMLRVTRTAQPSPRVMAWVTVLLRLVQADMTGYLVVGLTQPAALLNVFIASYGHPEVLGDSRFWLLALPMLFATVVLSGIGLLLFLQKVDAAERIRAIAVAAAMPFLAVALVLPLQYNALSAAIGIVLFLMGMVRYLMAQGERGLFLSRFLSPQVAQLVRSEGLGAALQPRTLDITVVCCDLRGFTAYAAAHPSAQVIELLREYYDAVGEAVAAFGATIKDYAGDGILILVGAPLPQVDHATQGIALAQQVMQRARAVATRWSRENAVLGAGIGVASGSVTVGTIGSASRLEYTAVGSAVNLASRLCEEARDGEILADEVTLILAGNPSGTPRQLTLKGFAGETACRVL